MSDPLGPGSRVGPFVVDAIIGTGSMAMVVGARDPSGRQVALKVLKSQLAKDPILARRFVREGRALSMVSHPNVVRVAGAAESEECHYIVMEWLRGPTLETMVREGARLTDAQLRVTGSCLASALSAIHAAGFLHRDVSASNVIMAAATDGSGYIVPTLLDFGIAFDDSETRLTRKGTVLGTIPYLAPEMTRGGQNATASSDQYALGVLLFYAATGEFPFSGTTTYEMMTQIATMAPRSMSDFRRDVGAPFVAAIARMLAKRPADRFPSLAAFQAEANR
jgi:serine/threonine-protein kinase